MVTGLRVPLGVCGSPGLCAPPWRLLQGRARYDSRSCVFSTSSKVTGIVVPQGPYSENPCPLTAVVMCTRSLSNSLSMSLGNKSRQDDSSSPSLTLEWQEGQRGVLGTRRSATQERWISQYLLSGRLQGKEMNCCPGDSEAPSASGPVNDSKPFFRISFDPSQAYCWAPPRKVAAHGHTWMTTWVSLNPNSLEGLSSNRKHVPNTLLVTGLSWLFGGVSYTDAVIVFVLSVFPLDKPSARSFRGQS